MTLHSREYAIEVYNKYMEEIGVFEEDRISIGTTKEEELEIRELLEAGIITEQEALERKEKTDDSRERILRAIRKGKVILEDDGTLTVRLVEPLKDSNGNVTREEVKIKKRFTALENKANSVGVKPNDFMGFLYAEIASRCGVTRITIERMDYKDTQLLIAIHQLFMLAE